MNAVQHSQTKTMMERVMLLATGLALFAALSYLLIQLSLLGVGDVQTAGAPAIPLVAAACYLVGGVLLLARRRWLLIRGAVINALVIGIFMMAYLNRPSVLFSIGGLATKIAQVLLEACLLYLIVTDWRSAHHQVVE